MVLVGKLTGKKLNTWLVANAASTETYAAKTIYDIPSEGRTVRVSQIGYDMVAVSNTPTPEQIHSIIDRHRAGALPFSGSSLLDRHYHDVPLLSIAWGVGQIGLPFSQSGAISILGLQLPLPADSTIIASIAPALPITPTLHLQGALRLRIEELAKSKAIAAGQATDLNSIITLFRQISAPLADNPSNTAFRELLRTAEVTRHGERVIITAAVTPTLLTSQTPEKIFSGDATTPPPPASDK